MDENIFLNCTCVDQRNCKFWRFWHFPSEKSYSCFASKKKICWSFIQRLSLTTQKWMKQLNTKNINVFTCLKFWIIFPCRYFANLFGLFSTPPTVSLSPFIYIMSKTMGVISLFLRTGKTVEIFQKYQLHITCYDLIVHINHSCKAVLCPLNLQHLKGFCDLFLGLGLW